jgi:hypothetical protein
MSALYIVFAIIVTLSVYLYLVHLSMTRKLPDVLKLSQPLWTIEELQDTYKKAETSPVDYTPFIPTKKNRRYIVVGGSGMLHPLLPPTPHMGRLMATSWYLRCHFEQA